MLVVLQDLLRTRYAPHLLFTDFRETLEDIQKGIEEYIAAKVNTELEPEVVAEPESEPTVVDEPEPELELEEFLVETSVDPPAKLSIELVSSTPAMRVFLPLRLLDVYDLLQILLEATGSQEFGFLMVHSTIDPDFIRNDLSRHAACALFEVPSTTAD